MSNHTFEFKQFSIKQDKCAMKVGTDAVLLGAWVNIDGAKNVLDIGTGTGIIALMIAQKSTILIDAIDIDKEACIQAQENVNGCKWSDRIKVQHISMQELSLQSKKKFELIVSNPPYFVDSSKALEEARTTARHTDFLSYDELIEGISKLLTSEGKFCVILPFKEGEMFRDMAQEKSLFLTKLTRIKTRIDKTEKRLLMQFEFKRNTFNENSIVIEKDERHSYSNEYIELTKDYYLGF